MVQDQGGCAICGKTVEERWHVDHNHSCEKCTTRRGSCEDCRRAVLCSNCNTGIGLFGEDVSVIQSAIEYLEYWRIQHAKP